MPGVGGGADSFLDGLRVMFIGVLAGFLILVTFYLASELLKAFMNIATDLKTVRAINEQDPTGRIPTA